MAKVTATGDRYSNNESSIYVDAGKQTRIVFMTDGNIWRVPEIYIMDNMKLVGKTKKGKDPLSALRRAFPDLEYFPL
jgi:hypothetical protein